MIVPAAVVHYQEVEEGVRAVEAASKPDVVRIRYTIGEDWADRWAIFFRIVLSDDAAEDRLRESTNSVERRLDERLNFPALGVLAYHNYRSESEQADLQEEDWA